MTTPSLSSCRWCLFALPLILVNAGFQEIEDQAAKDAARPTEVSLQVVKFPELDAAIKAQRGKVVVVDIWADFCLPCKEAFPHFIAMQERYGKDGLVCMSLSVDFLEDKDAALKFLRAQKAPFANYLIHEDVATWQDRWDIKGPPAALVYDRKGGLVRKFDNNDPDKQYTHKDVEKLVQELLASGR